MGSKLIIALTVVAAVVFVIVDVFAHGHFSPNKTRERVLDRVQSSHIEHLDGFDVDIENRTAILRGNVDTQEERRQATDQALHVPGLLTVYNDLKVDKIEEPLLSALKKELEADGVPGAFDYRLGTDPHTVTLDGWVPKDKPELRDAIEQLVRKMPGVRNVINNITLGEDQLVIDINRILAVGNIYFDYNKWDVRPESLPSIDKIAKLMLSPQYKDLSVRIEGHTDSTASRKYNQWLSEKRANAVRDLIVKGGVAADRLEAVGKGEDEPISPNVTPEGRANNRRIEFHVIHGNVVPSEDVDRLSIEAERKSATSPMTTSETTPRVGTTSQAAPATTAPAEASAPAASAPSGK
jgi:outer membrane protein OmpA-like peptidoglycan-associated protein